MQVLWQIRYQTKTRRDVFHRLVKDEEHAKKICDLLNENNYPQRLYYVVPKRYSDSLYAAYERQGLTDG